MKLKIDDKKLIQEMARQWVEICLMYVRYDLDRKAKIEKKYGKSNK